jgi:putative transposase
VKEIYQSIVKGNLNTYRDLFLKTDIQKVTDPYWEQALKLYSELPNENKEIFFEIIEQVQVDTVATLLGVFDGTVTMTEAEVSFTVAVEGQDEAINGNLQDLFLEYDEENR